MNFPPGGPGTIFKKRTERPEEAIQKQLIQLADLYSGQVPELRRLYAVPNGGYRTEAEAGILKAMGVRKGVPDLELPVARRTPTLSYHRLHIELKGPRETPTEEQLDWIEFLRKEGNCVQVCFTLEAAWMVLCWYLESRHGSLVIDVAKGLPRATDWELRGDRLVSESNNDPVFMGASRGETKSFVEFFLRCGGVAKVARE